MAGEVHFYLKDAKADVTPIYLLFKYGGPKPLKYYPGQSIKPSNWSKKRERVKNNNQTTGDGRHLLNDLLDNLAKECRRAYNVEIKNGIPLPETLRRYLDDYIDQNIHNKAKEKSKPTLFQLIDRFVAGEIKGKKGRELSDSSRDNFHACKVHLLAYQDKYKYKIDFDTITLDFFHSYTTFLKKQFTYKTKGPNGKKITGLSHNTIAKDITNLKGFMNAGVSFGYTTNLAHKHRDFSFTEEETDAVYLKETELVSLFDFPVENRKLDETKDLFVFGAFTGLRFSDYSTVGPENIIEESGDLFIKKKTQKTGEWVIIPCHPIVRRIFEKYADRPNKLPKTISNQKFNDYVKDVCKLAGLTEKGRLTDEPSKELWGCISSHTARRSFATNLFLESYPVLEIMKITGHKTEKSFLKYIRVSKLDAAKKLSAHMKKRWSEKLLRVA